MDESQQKSKLVVLLLAIFLGCYGVHNFYIGNVKNGVIQLCITLLSAFTLSIVSWIWAIYEGWQIYSGAVTEDANGVPYKD